MYNGESSKSLRELNLEVALRHRRSGRQRLLLAGITCLVCALAIIPLWRGLTALRISTPIAHDTSALIVSNVPADAITLDGHLVASQSPSLITLHTGINEISFAASPFQPHSCRLTVPNPSSSDTCHDPSGHESLNISLNPFRLHGKPIQPKYVIGFSLGLNDLSSTQGQSVVAFLATIFKQANNSLRTTVPIGQYYASGITDRGISLMRQAVDSLQATPEAVLSPPGHLVGCTENICPASVQLENVDQWVALHGHGWAVDVTVQYGWRFDTVSGMSIAHVLFPFSTVMSLTLAYDPNHGWGLADSANATSLQSTQVMRSLVATGLCDAGSAMLTVLSPENSSQSTAAVTDEGCRFEIQSVASSNNTPSASGVILWRFGVLLAADTQAHLLLPQLPIAPPAELAAVAN